MKCLSKLIVAAWGCAIALHYLTEKVVVVGKLSWLYFSKLPRKQSEPIPPNYLHIRQHKKQKKTVMNCFHKFSTPATDEISATFASFDLENQPRALTCSKSSRYRAVLSRQQKESGVRRRDRSVDVRDFGVLVTQLQPEASPRSSTEIPRRNEGDITRGRRTPRQSNGVEKTLDRKEMWSLPTVVFNELPRANVFILSVGVNREVCPSKPPVARNLPRAVRCHCKSPLVRGRPNT